MKLKILLLALLVLMVACAQVSVEKQSEVITSESLSEDVKEIVKEVAKTPIVEVVGDDKVKVLNSICDEVIPGKTATLNQVSTMGATCKEACVEADFERELGTRYCDTAGNLICYCYVDEELNALGARVS